MNKPHLSFANGLWQVQWPELTPERLDDVMETWGWVLKENSLLSADTDSMQGCICSFECKTGCPRWEDNER